jgi:hypothetical protein
VRLDPEARVPELAMAPASTVRLSPPPTQILSTRHDIYGLYSPWWLRSLVRRGQPLPNRDFSNAAGSSCRSSAREQATDDSSSSRSG